jgi:hypothetical protein
MRIHDAKEWSDRALHIKQFPPVDQRLDGDAPVAIDKTNPSHWRSVSLL